MDPNEHSTNLTTNSNTDSDLSQKQTQQQQQQNKVFSSSTTNGFIRNEVSVPTKHSDDLHQRKFLRQKSPHTTLDQSLDEWLDNCMRDTNYMNSSTEFLEKNHLANNVSGNGNPYVNLPSQNFPYPTVNFPTGPSDSNNRYFPSYQCPQANRFRIGGSFGYVGNMSPTYQVNNNQGFTSLPPAVNLTTELKNDIFLDPLDTLDNRRYRFSDPCLAAGNSDNDSKESTQNQEQQKTNPPRSNSNNLLATLLQQINILHDTNAKICRNLQDTKVDVEALKHTPTWSMRHRRDSLSGLSTHSQPMGGGGGYAFGTNSPAPTFHSGMYAPPGMMTDVVREVKEAARIREEALLSRVKAMVEERSWTINDTNLKIIRDMEEMKIQINHLKKERNESNTRLSHMEEEIKSLRMLMSHTLNVQRLPMPLQPQQQHNQKSEINYDTECDFPIRRLNNNNMTTTAPTTKNKRQNRHSLNLNYGIMSQNNDISTYAHSNSSNGNAEIMRSINTVDVDLRKNDNKFKYTQSTGCGISSGINDRPNNYSKSYSENHNGFTSHRPYESTTPTTTDRDDHLYTTPENEHNDDHIVQMEKETLELRRELQEAIAGQKHAEKKAQLLEDLVKNLQQTNKPNESTTTNHSAISSRNSSISESNSIISQGKLQLASQIQTISPKLISSNISLSGPVTDL